MSTRTFASRLLRGVVASATLAAGLVATAPAATAAEFTIVGRGNGHGIGLSQYGTQGQALAGRTAEQILASYFKGATVGTRSVGFSPRIGVALDQFSVRVVVRGGTAKVTIDGTTETAAADSIWTMTIDANGVCTTTRHGGASTVGGCPTFDPDAPARIEVRKGVTATSWSIHHEYGRDSVVEVIGDEIGAGVWRMDVVVELPLDQYLFGLAEMPYGWQPEALQAQAIAGRSYALWRMIDLGNSPDVLAARGCSCHLYDSQQDQVFKGWDRETTELWSRWQQAVKDTADQVVLSPGSIGTKDGVVQAFYSSSSNGRTESKHELWGGAAYPYLMSVDDHWAFASGTNNPHRHWEAEVAPATLASRVGLDALDRVDITARSTSGAATEVRFVGEDDHAPAEVVKSGTWVRQTLGLRSTTIDSIQIGLFSDDDGSVHESSINWLASRGITKGCNPPTNDLFCPDRAVTRGEMAVFIVRALQLPPGETRFRDVTASHMFASYVDSLAQAGITKGCNPPTNDLFCPDRAVTRGEMATFLTNALDLPAADGGFQDTASSVHSRAIGALKAAGITQGCNPPQNTRYCPDAPVTRGEMATFLKRADEL